MEWICNYLVIIDFLCFFWPLCSFCLKGETLDGKSSAVIDYTPYLKFTQRWDWSWASRFSITRVCVCVCTCDAATLSPLCRVATTTWAMRMTAAVWTAVTARRVSPSTPTSLWWPTRRAGATSVARWSRGLRSSTPRRWHAPAAKTQLMPFEFFFLPLGFNAQLLTDTFQGYLEELVRLRESQLKNVETENKRLRAKVEEQAVQSQQEKEELEAVVLELQAQLWGALAN